MIEERERIEITGPKIAYSEPIALRKASTNLAAETGRAILVITKTIALVFVLNSGLWIASGHLMIGTAIMLLRGGAPAITTMQAPGPSLALFNNQNYYACSNNRYAAPNNGSPAGSPSNNGLSAATPWDVATAASYAAPAGTCINLATGTYNTSTVGATYATCPSVSAVVCVSNGGTSSSKTGYVVWRCSTMPFSFSNGVLQGEGSGCVIRGNDSTQNVLSVGTSTTSFLMFDAIEVFGAASAAHDTHDVACIDDENSNTSSHHLWLLNSDTHGCGLGGIQWNDTDWLFIIHSVTHDNAFTNAFNVCGSGYSVYEPVGLSSYTPTVGNPDYWHSNTTGLTYSIVFAYNVAYHNYNLQVSQTNCGANGNTDGEGIILDDFAHAQNACPGVGVCPITNPTLVMGNILYNNGGHGVTTGNNNNSNHQTIINNTVYGNMWDTFNGNSFRGDVEAEPALLTQNNNNVVYTIQYPGIASPNTTFLSQGSAAGSSTWHNNLSYPGGETDMDANSPYPLSGSNKNLDGSDPSFVNASTSTPNFALQGGSPAIGFGQAFDLYQQTGSVDSGACPSQLAHCP